jgi:Asp-tRNA(Asn)/Glu-tRNA(Gln) amidotransferase A subunit family amidase
MESDRPGLLCRDIMSCAVFYNYMRGTSAGDPQSRDVPFSDPSKEDMSTYTIVVVDNSETTAWPPGWDTPLKGQRGNVAAALEGLGATVMVKESLSEVMTGNQLYNDTVAAGIANTQGFDWYWLNIEGFFEKVFKYGSAEGMAYGPVWVGQNFK